MAQTTERTTIAVRSTTKQRMRAVMEEGQTYDDWIDEQLRVHERVRWAELEAVSYAAVPEQTPDDWGDLAEHGARLSAAAMSSLPPDAWS